MSTDTDQLHVSSKMIPGRQRMHTRPLHSVNPMFNHFHRNFYWSARRVLSYFFFSLHPISLVGFWRLKFHSFFSPFLTRQILGEVDVKTRQSRDVKNINTFFFFYCPEGKGGAGGWAVGSVKETRTLSQPSSSVIRRHDKVAARKTLQGWHNPKTD